MQSQYAQPDLGLRAVLRDGVVHVLGSCDLVHKSAYGEGRGEREVYVRVREREVCV